MRFGAVSFDGASALDEEDNLGLDDRDAHQNNQRLSATRRIGAVGMRMLSALLEGIEADFFSLVLVRDHHDTFGLGIRCKRRKLAGCNERWKFKQPVH